VIIMGNVWHDTQIRMWCEAYKLRSRKRDEVSNLKRETSDWGVAIDRPIKPL
jgi:hypothetical protein